MDENKEQQIKKRESVKQPVIQVSLNENVQDNKQIKVQNNEQINAQVQAQNEAPVENDQAYYKRRLDGFREKKHVNRNLDIRLKAIRVSDKLDLMGKNKKYTVKLKDDSLEVDKRQAAAEASDNINTVAGVEAYRFMQKYNTRKQGMSNALNQLSDPQKPVSRAAELKILEIKEAFNDDKSDINEKDFDGDDLIDLTERKIHWIWKDLNEKDVDATEEQAKELFEKEYGGKSKEELAKILHYEAFKRRKLKEIRKELKKKDKKASKEQVEQVFKKRYGDKRGKELLEVLKSIRETKIKEIEDEDRKNNPGIDKDDFAISSYIKPLLKPEDKAGNQRLLDAMRAGNEEFAKALRGYFDEILMYDFSERMLNKEYLAENGDIVCSMIDRASAMDDIMRYFGVQDLIDEQTVLLLKNKAGQAQTFKLMFYMYAKEIGLSLSEDNKFEFARNFSKENVKNINRQDKEDNRNKLKALRKEEEVTLENLQLKRERESGNRDTSADNLGYYDFLRVIGEKNRGQVVLGRDGKLNIINNGYFRRNSTGEASRENVTVKLRFIEVALERLEKSERKAYRSLFMSMLHLKEDDVFSKPLSRKDILAVVTEIRNKDSHLKQTRLKEGNSALGTFAAKLDTYFGAEPAAEDVKSVKSRRTKAVRDRIKTVMRNALGARAKLPSDDKINKIIKDNMSLLKDEVLKAAENMDSILKNTGAAQQGSFLMGGDMQEQLLDKLIAHCVKRLCASTPGELDAADYRMERFAIDTALTTAGKAELIDKLHNTNIGHISVAGTLGLYDAVEDRRAQFEREMQTEEFKESIDTFAYLMESVSKLAEYNYALLVRRSANVDISKKELVETAHAVDLLMKGDTAKLDRIADILKGTRFEAGYKELKAKIADGLDLVADEKAILQGLSAEREAAPKVIKAPVELAKLKVLTKAEQKTLASLSEKDRDMANILLLKKLPSDLIKNNEDDNAKLLLELRSVLRNIPVGQAFITSMSIGGSEFRLEQDAAGSLKMRFGKDAISIPVSADRLVEYIESDMCSNSEKYGKNEVYYACFLNVEDDEKQMDMGQLAKIRDLAVKVLSNMSGKPAAWFTNTATKTLIERAKEALTKNEHLDFTVFNAARYELDRINELETDTMLNMCEKMQSEELDNKVILKLQEKPPVPDEPQWKQDELLVKKLISEMIYGSSRARKEDVKERAGNESDKKEGLKKLKKNKMLSDREKDELMLQLGHTRGFMMRQALVDNYKAVKLIIDNEKLVDDVIRQMSVPDAEEGQADFKQDIIDGIKDGVKVLSTTLKLAGKTEEEIRKELEKLNNKDDKDHTKQFSDAENKIMNGVTKCCTYIQGEIKKAAEQIFNYQEEAGEEAPVLLPLDAKNLSLEELEKRKKAHSDQLVRLIKKEALKSSGQGAFNKEILCNYFEKSDEIDKMKMVASIFSNAGKKSKLPEDATKERKDAELLKQRGNTLGGFLKGAGPLMQKLLQGMPEQVMPPEMQLAVKDMKSKLMPIPTDVIRARMLSIVERSGGSITSVEVVKSLGAASVGQAFLCRLHGPQLPEKGRAVVIKLLRPDARNRMGREKKIMEECAKSVDNSGSMETTLKGQTDRITEELDLTVEARNIKQGNIYNDGDPSVKSVGVSELVEPTANTLVLELAEGTTVDGYLEDIKNERFEIMSGFFEEAGDKKLVLDKVTGKPKKLQAFKEGASLTDARTRLQRSLERMEKRQKFLAVTAEKWVKEGIYGKGFYHGDLHAGNIMISDEGVTLIDFGNATVLDENQKTYITRLSAAAAAGETDDFIEAFFVLIGEGAKQRYRDKLPQFKTQIEEVFRIGNKENAGQRISLIIMKAQTLKIEVPAAISNFSQSQMRIQNTVDDINNQIVQTRAALAELDALAGNADTIDIQQRCQKEALDRHESIDKVAEEYIKKMNTAKIDTVITGVKKTGARDLEDFDRLYVNIFKSNAASVGLMKGKLAALRDLQKHPEHATAEMSLQRAEAEFINAYSQACVDEALASTLAEDIRERLSRQDEASVKAVETELKAFFKDTANSGAQLEEAYRAVRSAQSEKADEATLAERMNTFIRTYFAVNSRSLQETIRRKKKENDKPKTFFNVMTEILMNNLGVSLKRFGLRKGNHYRRKLA